MELREIATLSRRTGISVDSLKRVVSSELVDHRSRPSRDSEASQATLIDKNAACRVAIAASLLGSGITEDWTRDVLQWATAIGKKGRDSQQTFLAAQDWCNTSAAFIQFADGTHVRVRDGKRVTAWYDIDGHCAVCDDAFEPTVVVSVDVEKIRDALGQ